MPPPRDERPMTVKLFELDPSISTFKAKVLKKEGDWVVLDETAFFPGGGGQDADAGTLSGLQVTELKGKHEIMHKVPGNAFALGQEVEGWVDVPRRRELMMAHTGEHLLYSSLQKEVPEMELVKIAITPSKKSFIVKGAFGWDEVVRAEERANRAIFGGAEVSCQHVHKGDAILEQARVKLDRIPGDEVRLIRIGDYDLAACAGLHVADAKDIKLLLVSKFTSAKPAGDWEVEFEVGDKAVAKALALSALALKACERTGSQPADLLVAMENREKEADRCRDSLRAYARKELLSLQPESVQGIQLYAAALGAIDRKDMMDAATRLAAAGGAVILASEDEKTMLVVAASPALPVDCREILNQTLAEFGGKGGGKKEFASGGTPAKVDAAQLVAKARGRLLAALPQ
jgi:alanyl-tRNA synthetase